MNGKLKNIMTAAAICLSTVIFGVVIYGGIYTAVRRPNITAENEVTEDGTGAVISDGESNGIQLLSTQITPNDDGTGSCTITASIQPANLSDKTVTMSVAWADASSDWASGKTVTDYVTVTQTSTGSLTATLNCLQAFGEQVILTVTSNLDSNYYAESTIDYVKRVTSIGISLSGSSSIRVGEEFTVTFTPVFSTGTLTGDISFSDYGYYGMNDVDNTITKTINTYLLNKYSGLGFYTLSGYLDENMPVKVFDVTSKDTTSASVTMTISDSAEFIRYNNSADSADALEDFYDSFSTPYYIAVFFGISYTYSYNGIEYASSDFTYDTFIFYTTTNSVSAVSIDDDNYIF